MSPQSIVVSDLWVLARTGGRRILLRSLAAKMAGLQRDTEDGGPVAHKERWSQGSLESEQGIPQIDLGVGTLVWGVSVGCLVEAAMFINQSVEESAPSEESLLGKRPDRQQERC